MSATSESSDRTDQDVDDAFAGNSREETTGVSLLSSSSEGDRTSAFTTQYEVHHGRLCRKRRHSGKLVLEPLCNFNATIVDQEVEDAGEGEQRTFFLIEGRLASGRPLAPARVAASEFGSMSWVTQWWGADAVVSAGITNRDHLRAAIQELSPTSKRSIFYAHLGWRRINGDYYFLHSGGAIGPNGLNAGITVVTDEGARNYELPEPPVGEALRAAASASLKFLRLTNPAVTVPIYASIFRAILSELKPSDFALFLEGRTGSQKSELAAMAQAHFGKQFDRTRLPGNWASTSNALERQAHFAKDCLTVIDDFAPAGGSADHNRLHRKAEHVLRSQGNRSGRGRLSKEGKFAGQYAPRGIILCTGEDLPRGQSLIARLLVLEVERGAVDLTVLTQCQQVAADGLFAQFTSAFVSYVSRNFITVKLQLDDAFTKFRPAYFGANVHPRLPDILANLRAGWEVFLTFLSDEQILAHYETLALRTQADEALRANLIRVDEERDEHDCVQVFVDALRSLLIGGFGHVVDVYSGGAPENSDAWGWRADTDGSHKWVPQGKKLGWLREGTLLLNPPVAYMAVSEFASRQGMPALPAPKTLWKRTTQKGISRPSDCERRNLRKEVVGSTRENCLVIPNFRGLEET